MAFASRSGSPEGDGMLEISQEARRKAGTVLSVAGNYYVP